MLKHLKYALALVALALLVPTLTACGGGPTSPNPNPSGSGGPPPTTTPSPTRSVYNIVAGAVLRPDGYTYGLSGDARNVPGVYDGLVYWTPPEGKLELYFLAQGTYCYLEPICPTYLAAVTDDSTTERNPSWTRMSIRYQAKAGEAVSLVMRAARSSPVPVTIQGGELGFTPSQ